MKHNHPPKVKNFLKKSKNNPVVRDKFMNQLHKWDAKRADEILKLCPSCKRVWEECRKDKVRYEYYPVFPKLGKGRKTCPTCIKD